MKIKWYEQEENVISAMRIGFMICVVTGSITVLAGVVGFFMGIEGAATVVGSGAGMIGLSEVSKAWQASHE